MLKYLLSGLLALLLAPVQAFPDRPVRIVVPFPPGAASDTLARLLAQGLSQLWQQPVIVENKPGAGSLVGAQAVAHARADGHVIFVGNIGSHGVSPALYARLPYDPVKDFAPVTLLVTIPNLLAANPALPANKLQELIALARSAPGSLTVSSPGMATSAHLNIALLQALGGIELNHVPYKGSVAATQALLAGEVQLCFDSVTSLLPYVRAGRVKALAVTSLARSPVFPDLATLAEQGLPGFDVLIWFGFFVPADTPAEVIKKISGDTARLLNTAELHKRLSEMGMQVVGSTPEHLRRHVERELKRWQQTSIELGLKNE